MKIKREKGKDRNIKNKVSQKLKKKQQKTK